jgi:hypothetical protein
MVTRAEPAGTGAGPDQADAGATVCQAPYRCRACRGPFEHVTAI